MLPFFPYKQWGQNFLVDKKIRQQIASWVIATNVNQVLEIGPGYGAISDYLIDHCQLVVVEIDKRLVNYLQKRYHGRAIKIIDHDFLSIQGQDYFSTLPILLFGNIPYSITTPIIKKFLAESCYQQGIFMVQKEYADRLQALVGQKNYSSLTVYLQTFCVIEKKLVVDKHAFTPVPTVDSVVIQLLKKPLNWSFWKRKQYSYFLQNCFQMKRKTIFNNCKQFITNPKQLLEKQQISLNKRPEEISVKEYQQLFALYYQTINQLESIVVKP